MFKNKKLLGELVQYNIIIFQRCIRYVFGDKVIALFPYQKNIDEFISQFTPTNINKFLLQAKRIEDIARKLLGKTISNVIYKSTIVLKGMDYAEQVLEMYLEYEKAGNLDDIVLFQDNKIVAYQVKYAVNPHDVYKTDDFIDTNSPVCFKKFANSWKTLRERFPEHNLTVCLCTNRALDPALVDLIAQNDYNVNR